MTCPHCRCPAGPGRSAWRSRDGYPFKVWSLLEMADAGIVPERIDDAKVVEGACDGV